jgi:uncharacterized OB-fold protein
MADRPFTSASFNQFLSEGRLRGSKCQICGVVYMPPRPLCLACHSEAMEWVEMEGQGKLVAYTAVHIGPKLIIEEGYDERGEGEKRRMVLAFRPGRLSP